MRFIPVSLSDFLYFILLLRNVSYVVCFSHQNHCWHKHQIECDVTGPVTGWLSWQWLSVPVQLSTVWPSQPVSLNCYHVWCGTSFRNLCHQYSFEFRNLPTANRAINIFIFIHWTIVDLRWFWSMRLIYIIVIIPLTHIRTYLLKYF